MDVCFMFAILFVGFVALLGLFYYTPAKLAAGIQDALDWLRQRCPEEDYWSASSRALCGSGLLFLVLCVLGLSLEPPNDSQELWLILASIYLQICVIRFYGAALVNVPFGLIAGLKSRDKISRLSAMAGSLTSGAGLLIIGNIFQSSAYLFHQVGPRSGDAVVNTLFISFFVVSNFCAGIVWGAFVQWLALKWHE